MYTQNIFGNFRNFQKTGIYMIEHWPIDMCTKFEVVISKNEGWSAFERSKMAVFRGIPMLYQAFLFSRFIRNWVRRTRF